MKTIICVMFMCLLLPVQADDTERHAYCLSCLTAAQELERVMKEAPAGSRRRVLDSLISGGVCDKLPSNKHNRVSEDKMTSSCKHLFESHYDQFTEALLNKEPKHLKIVLCYEQSTACVGVKQHSFEDSKGNAFTDSYIETLLRDNSENVRIAQPIHSGSPVNSRDEL